MDVINGFTAVNGNGTATPSVKTEIDVNPASSPPSTAGVKRKRENKPAVKFYAVRVGKAPGVYHSWPECLEQVKSFPKAQFKSFPSLTEAQAFVDNKEGSTGGGSGGSGKFYGVREGRVPGVYNSWPEVLEQITGWKGPKHKVFKTKAEAELFVNEGRTNGQTTAVESIEFSDLTPKKSAKTSKGSKKVGVIDELSPGLEGGEYEPGDGPLPEDAQDNFDPRITLDQSLGTARYKTAAEHAKTKYQASAPAVDAPVRIYTDGSTLFNGQPDCIAGVGVYFGPKDKRNISEPLSGTKQTNQRAELTALIRALEVAPRDRRIIILTDSQYGINCITKWFIKWRTNNWQNASNKPVENKDLVSKIIDLLEERQRLNAHRYVPDEADEAEEGERQYWNHGPAAVEFKWVKGHAGDEGNSAADELAVNGAKAARELGEDVVWD